MLTLTTITTRAVRITAAAAIALALAAAAEAGPPLICHQFDAGKAPLLPWAATGQGWNTPDRSYAIKNLTSDMLRLLSPDAPILARMENMRRAAIYAGQDERVAAELLTAVLARVQADAGKGRDPLAWFDAGYSGRDLSTGCACLQVEHARHRRGIGVEAAQRTGWRGRLRHGEESAAARRITRDGVCCLADEGGHRCRRAPPPRGRRSGAGIAPREEPRQPLTQVPVPGFPSPGPEPHPAGATAKTKGQCTQVALALNVGL